MLNSNEVLQLIRDLWKAMGKTDEAEHVRMMRAVQVLRERGVIAPQVSLDAMEQIEDFYERHIRFPFPPPKMPNED